MYNGGFIKCGATTPGPTILLRVSVYPVVRPLLQSLLVSDMAGMSSGSHSPLILISLSINLAVRLCFKRVTSSSGNFAMAASMKYSLPLVWGQKTFLLTPTKYSPIFLGGLFPSSKAFSSFSILPKSVLVYVLLLG